MSDIEWTEKTWNPVNGCSRVSPGCDNCYAMRFEHRFSGPGQRSEGLTVLRPKSAKRPGVDWSGVVRLNQARLDVPMRRKKPTTWFVNSTSDLFHDALTNEEIAAVFGVMAACPQHTFQVLTKRAERMREWFEWITRFAAEHDSTEVGLCATYASQQLGRSYTTFMPHLVAEWPTWPLPNVWNGVSAENQELADERFLHLLATPAAVRFVSAEPLLGPIDFTRVKYSRHYGTGLVNSLTGEKRGHVPNSPLGTTGSLDWVILGSESGYRSRPMQTEWARSIVDQCVDAGVAVFTKQIATEHDRKGGKREHWPAGNWPMEFPPTSTFRARRTP